MKRLATAILLLAAFAAAAEGNYVRKWLWTAPEQKRLAELEKKAAEAEGLKTLEHAGWVVKTELSPRFTAECALFMEIFTQGFLEVFSFKTGVEAEITPTLVVYGSPGAYQAACPMPGSRGVFMVRGDGSGKPVFTLATYMQESKLNSFSNCYLPVIQHEGTHCLVQKLVGEKRVPCWLTEGMATFFEYWDYRSDASPGGTKAKDVEARRKRLTISPTKHHLRRFVQEKSGVYPPLSYVLGLVTSEQWSPDHMGPLTHAHYALAESVADFMISDKDGRAALQMAFKRLCEAGKEDEEKPLLDETETARLEPKWHKHLQSVWGINGKPPPKEPKK